MKHGRMHVDELTTAQVSPLQAVEVYVRLMKDLTGVLGLIFDWTSVSAAA
jgi:hypothetical protein